MLYCCAPRQEYYVTVNTSVQCRHLWFGHQHGAAPTLRLQGIRRCPLYRRSPALDITDRSVRGQIGRNADPKDKLHRSRVIFRTPSALVFRSLAIAWCYALVLLVARDRNKMLITCPYVLGYETTTNFAMPGGMRYIAVHS